MFFAAIMKRYKKSGRYSMSALLIMYFVSIFVSMSDKLDKLKYITPFKYFEPSALLREESYEMVYVLISIGIIVVAMTATLIIYPRRDLRT
jgi:ABC-2 type transport system permease protein